MRGVRLRLQKVGVKNHHKWWIIAQPHNRSFGGSNYLERIGYWFPHKRQTVERSIVLNTHRIKYWLATGATPTNGVYKLLAKAEMLPKKPIPLGCKYVYEKPKKEYKLSDFKNIRWGFAGIDVVTPLRKKTQFIKNRRYTDCYIPESKRAAIQNQIENYIVQRLGELEHLAKNTENTKELRKTGEFYSPEIFYQSKKKEINTDCDTDLINSDEPEFYQRKRNFQILSKKLKGYFDNTYKFLHGKDLQYNEYVRKIEKLTRKTGLDEKAFLEFNRLVTIERERNEVLIRRLSRRFHLDFEKSEEFKEQFFKSMNNGVKDEALYKKFVKEDLEEIEKAVNQTVNKYYIRIGHDYKAILKEEEKLKNQDLVEDFKILRMAKILKKIKESYMYGINREEFKEGASANNSILGLTKSIKADYLKALDNHLIDPELLNKTAEKFNKEKGLDSYFFHSVNDKIIGSPTFKRLQKKLLLSDHIDSNSNSQEISDIYFINDEIIDSLCTEIETMLKKSFELNDIYNDDEPDLIVQTKRSKAIDKRIKDLKEKYGDVNVLYDDIYGDSEEMKSEIRNFKQEFDYEVVQNSHLEYKFKSCYKKFTLEKKDNADIRKKFAETYNKAIQDLLLESQGKKEIYKPNLETVDDEFYYNVRRDIETEKYGETISFFNYEDYYFDAGIFALDKTPVVYRRVGLTKKKAKKFTPEKKKIHEANSAKQYNWESIEHSLTKSFNVNKTQLEHIINRFVDLFGNNSDIIYPEGFRHLETFEIYQQHYPKLTPLDYQEESK